MKRAAAVRKRINRKQDIVVIGAGIIGTVTARQLQQRYPDKRITLLDKEFGVGRHQTGHNSGVVHAGVYYRPGSLKARFCKQGLEETLRFCREQHLPVEQCGKLIVATNESEEARMQDLYRRCNENNVDCMLLDREQLRAMEPRINGIGAIHVPATAITDFTAVCRRMAELFTEAGGALWLNAGVTAIEENGGGVRLHTSAGVMEAGLMIACAGLQSDRLARLHGFETDFRIVPFRGEYYRLPDSRKDLIRHLIYPVPDPALPFLGVHLTRMIDGDITAGPNAVTGWKREGYGRFNIGLRDTVDVLSFPGFWKLAGRHAGYGLAELKNSFFRRCYLNAVRKYCPELTVRDLQPYPAGVRAQAVREDGSLVDDFLFLESPRSLHVCNAPSPAATSAIPIANHICDRLAPKIGYQKGN